MNLLERDQYGEPRVSPASLIGALKWGGIVFILLILAALTIETVDAGTVRVVTRWGKVTGRKLHPGAHLIIPLAESTLKYNTKKVTYEASANPDNSKATYTDYSVDTTTSDGQQISLNYTIRFSVDPTKTDWIANNIGTESDLVEKIIKADSRIHTRNIAREYEAGDLYTAKVGEFQIQVEDEIRPIFAENGIILDEFGSRSITFSPEYVNAVEAKQIEKEKIATEEYIASQEAQKKQQRITKAEGQAQEQRLQKETLTPELLQKLWIEKWKGEIPQVMTDGNSLIFQLPN